MQYDFKRIESKWIRRWEEKGTHRVDLINARKPFYNLMMFPYPSAEGLHVGNVFAFTGSDVQARYRRACGCNVFEPMGFDAFGIHSENYAIKTGRHPRELIPENIRRFRDGQLRRLGFMYDWSHEIVSTDPAYYKWTQWIFVKLFEAGLAYRKEAPVNWCPSCRTVLADEQAAGGACERCGARTERRKLLQWFFRITDYAPRLLDNLDRLDWSESTKSIQRQWIGRGAGGTGYRLHDWCISRQRCWGPPIPVVHCPACGPVAVPEAELPVLLPDIRDYRPDGSGVSPLARCPEFVDARCPRCGRAAERETDVSDNFLCSAWYFLRYPSSGRGDVPFDPELTEKWLPVDMYVGGNEHAVLHLMYTRFITMVLHDLGYLSFEEPFKRFRAHGLLISGGAKMSKSKGNVVNPDYYMDTYGADAFRTYLLFFSNFQEGGDFRDGGIAGVRRFLNRVWRYVNTGGFTEEPVRDRRLRALVHGAVEKVTEDIRRLHYNTAVAAAMELFNGLSAAAEGPQAAERPLAAAKTLLQLLAPFAPCITHELWERLGQVGMILDAPWPWYDEPVLEAETVEYVLQVDGRIRDRIRVPAGSGRASVERRALQSAAVRRYTADRGVGRVIFVPGRLVNVVTKRAAPP